MKVADGPIYVFTKDAVLRSVRVLEATKIHEHFPGYLAILRGLKLAAPERTVRSSVIWDLHNRYLRVDGEGDPPVYVRPFASRGSSSLHTFNPNVAGSYGASSIRARGKLVEVIAVEGEGQNAVYGLKDDHAALAFQYLLKRQVPIGALTAFFYRDYGFQLEEPEPDRIIKMFRQEFGLESDISEEQEAFETLFLDDTDSYSANDLELLNEDAQNG
ncbi:hypothetical protein [Limimaricola soesokkakensis]|uniref:hypothetical protein n=1 Tax=Limimaricola soesokkakensis TaxID=1343159 RepID=UPI000A26FD6B|nr:hypothetical protein [Limimaricola soesokkakensis]